MFLRGSSLLFMCFILWTLSVFSWSLDACSPSLACLVNYLLSCCCDVISRMFRILALSLTFGISNCQSLARTETRPAEWSQPSINKPIHWSVRSRFGVSRHLMRQRPRCSKTFYIISILVAGHEEGAWCVCRKQGSSASALAVWRCSERSWQQLWGRQRCYVNWLLWGKWGRSPSYEQNAPRRLNLAPVQHVFHLLSAFKALTVMEKVKGLCTWQE